MIAKLLSLTLLWSLLATSIPMMPASPMQHAPGMEHMMNSADHAGMAQDCQCRDEVCNPSCEMTCASPNPGLTDFQLVTGFASTSLAPAAAGPGYAPLPPDPPQRPPRIS